MNVRISLEEALEELRGHIAPLGEEVVPLAQGLGRTLAGDMDAQHDQPPFPRSPLDGYALRAQDIQNAAEETPALLTVVDTVYAGEAAVVPVRRGEAVRIMTGAMLPVGCDCVVRQEDTDLGRDRVAVRRSLRPYENYVPQGSDHQAGTRLLTAGARLDAAALGILASDGFDAVPVLRLPTVGLLTTGDEVVSPGTSPLPAGKIYGSNGVLLSARLRELGIRDLRTDHSGDDSAETAAALRTLLADCHCVITTGGISVGEKDILHQALPLLGARQLFWRVKLKPGTPAMFSLWEGKPILSLSGNPFAALATFELLARPMLAALTGDPRLLPVRGTAILDSSFPKASPGRRFVRGRLEGGRVTLPDDHASGSLASLAGCNCLAEIPAGSPPLQPGCTVTVYQ